MLRDGDRSELERGLFVTGRQKLRELGVRLCGIQETRLPVSSSCNCDDWISPVREGCS